VIYWLLETHPKINPADRNLSKTIEHDGHGTISLPQSLPPHAGRIYLRRLLPDFGGNRGVEPPDGNGKTSRRDGGAGKTGEPGNASALMYMNGLRIVSFLPAATEMVCALGLEDRLVGVSHECDFPAPARSKPVVVRNALQLETMSMREIDVAVSECIGSGRSLYTVDERLLEQLAPTHILTQALCDVCAPAGNEITRALNALSSKPEVLWFTPHGLEDIFGNMRQLGRATDRLPEAEGWIASARARLQKTADRIRHEPRPRVFCLEWTDPYYCCGHWVPEMIDLAGGEDRLGRKGADSVRIAWDEIAAWSPEILIVSPCGFGAEKAVALTKQLLRQPAWSELPAVREGRVFAVDANAYFARPGPRAVDGVELLAHLFHPKLCAWDGPDDAFHRVCRAEVESCLA
jgi:iron complex transport system substrate-binding protein